MPAPILVTKLFTPPISSYQVPRPRLVERLTAALLRKLVLVSAPAGFGKTNLLAEWAAVHQPSQRVAWLSLDEADNDIVRFLTYLIAALQRAHPSIGQDVPGGLSDLRSGSEHNEHEWVEVILTVLINQVCALDESVVLVLDDYHLMQAQPIHDAMIFLINHLPQNCHIVIATRADPPLGLARLRGRGQLFELRQIDLCFTSDETGIYLNDVMGLDINESAVAALAARTEGWVAGLQMAAVSMKGRTDLQAFVDDFTGSQHQILDYLVEEVLQGQPEPVQLFLLQTSVLDRMCGSLCDAVTGGHDSQAMLDWLEHRNLFVYPLDDQQQWYRYHHLFADLLQHRLQQMPSISVPELHRRASAWFENRHYWPPAIDHALAAGDGELAARLTAHSSGPFGTPDLSTIAGRPVLTFPPSVSPVTLIEPLSDRELEVLRLLSADLSSPAIAARLYISPNTTRSHLRHIYEKLNAHSRYEAIVRARELHLI
jgi:LuxR family transcriptional regulator, maltose regulon positive regulatory protein